MLEEAVLDDQSVQNYFSAASSVEKLDESQRLVLLWAKDLADLSNPSSIIFPNTIFYLLDPPLQSSVQRHLDRIRNARSARQRTVDRALAILNYTFREIYLAVCKGDKRYEKEMKQIGKSGTLLIGTIAGNLAPVLNAEMVILAATVAAILRLVIKTGIQALCEFGKYRYF
jgi:hypothetical protein